MFKSKGQDEKMKKLPTYIFCILSLFALMLSGNVAAYDASYEHVDWNVMNSVIPVIDGTYGTPATGDNCEWANSEKTTFGTSGIWRDEWAMVGSDANEYMLIETADATDDAGDYWEICFDGGTVASPGDATPQANDRRVVITGHGGTATTQWYEGTGSGWSAIAAPAAATFAESKSTSPTINSEHYILEMSLTPKSGIGVEALWAVSIAYYDAHTGGEGLQQWPPTNNPNNPTTWGYVSYEYGTTNPAPDVPEGFALIAIVALAAAAVVTGTVFLRKRASPRFSPKSMV